MEEGGRDWEFHLRSLLSSARDSNYAPTRLPILQSSIPLYQLCKSENSEELIARVYPHLNKIFQRSVASISKPQTSNGLLLLYAAAFLTDSGPFLYLLLKLPSAAETVLVVALEKLERSAGSLFGSSIASIQNSAAPEMLLAFMDEAYTGSTIGDGGADSESEDSTNMTVDPIFLDLLKDENDGLPIFAALVGLDSELAASRGLGLIDVVVTLHQSKEM